jgi:hypothetical protein
VDLDPLRDESPLQGKRSMPGWRQKAVLTRKPYPLLVAAGEQEENGPQAVRFGGPPKKSAGVRTVSQKMTFFGQ